MPFGSLTQVKLGFLQFLGGHNHGLDRNLEGRYILKRIVLFARGGHFLNRKVAPNKLV